MLIRKHNFNIFSKTITEVIVMKDKLKSYKGKRDFKKTKEPIGKRKTSGKKLHFVVDHHLASHDHYDFRLEYNGVLKSWAVPKGPSYNPKDKRLSVLVEDHPLEYRNFEGTIPKGEYGGGTVMIWDEGYYEVIGNFSKDFKKGSLKFILYGKRLKGAWTLVHFDKDNWLLIKENDEYKNFKDINKFKTSVKTGRTMSEITNNLKRKTRKENAEIEITNPDKIIYSRPKITKLEVVNYYKKVAEKMLPYVSNRIISTIRCPEGIKKDKFFKKHLDNPALKKIILPNTENKKDDYYYITDVNGLISEAQMNSIEFHIWGSNVSDLENPNYMVFDLDPDEKLSLTKLRQGVKDLKQILNDLKLKAYLKTSGGKGYHIVVPISYKITWEEFRKVAKNIALLMVAKWPDKYVANMRKENRKGKIFIDWVRNTRSSTSVAPYSLRARDNAPVSMPIKWSELEKVKPNEITMAEALRRLKRKDPWEGFFDN